MDGNIQKNTVNVNKTLQNVKDNSWVGYTLNDTTEIDFVKDSLKDMLSGDLTPRERLEITKQLMMVENSRVDRAKHLDMVMLKRSEISSNTGDNKKKVVTNLFPEDLS